MTTPRCPKCNSMASYIQEGAYACMMCGKRWPVNGAAPILITKIDGGKSMTEKTSSGKKGTCTNCGKIRFIASKVGHCHTCNNAVKGKNTDAARAAALADAKNVKQRKSVKPASTTPDRGKTEAIETLPAFQEDIQKSKAIVRAMVEKRKTDKHNDTPDVLSVPVNETFLPSVKSWGRASTSSRGDGLASALDKLRAERDYMCNSLDKLNQVITMLESL